MSSLSFSVLLLETQNPGNLGAVARIMMNMGFDDLRLIRPKCEVLCSDSLNRAVHAKEILNSASIHQTIGEALKDIDFLFGTAQKKREIPLAFFHLDQWSQSELSKLNGKVGLLFGTEDRGLSKNELKYCHGQISIASSEKFPSLNLSHAVGLLLYEINQKLKLLDQTNHPDKVEIKVAKNSQRREFYFDLKNSLLNIDFLNPQNPDLIMKEIENIFEKSQLSHRELQLLRGIVRQIKNHSRLNKA